MHQGFDADVDEIGEDIFAPRGLEHCADQDTTPAVTEGRIMPR
jgi:hypothetical protein